MKKNFLSENKDYLISIGIGLKNPIIGLLYSRYFIKNCCENLSTKDVIDADNKNKYKDFTPYEKE